MTIVLALADATFFLAYSNGANDNFKGVATLYGSSTTTYRVALLIGTVATFAGCIASVFLADTLIKAFSGKGLVPNNIAESQHFLLAVATVYGHTCHAARFSSFNNPRAHGCTHRCRVYNGWAAS